MRWTEGVGRIALATVVAGAVATGSDARAPRAPGGFAPSLRAGDESAAPSLFAQTTAKPASARHGSTPTPARSDRPAAGEWTSARGDAAMTGRAAGGVPAKPGVVWEREIGAAAGGGVAIADGSVLVGDAEGRLHALSFASGEPRWVYQAGAAIHAAPLVANGVVYVGDDAGIFHAVDLANGEKRWAFDTGGEIHGGATLAGDCLLVGSYDMSVRCLSIDGKERWRLETENYVHAAAAVADGEVWIAGCDGYLRGIELASGRELARVELGGYVAANPAIAGHRAVVGSYENEVLAVDLDKRTVSWRFSDPDRTFPFAAPAAIDPTTAWIGGRDRMVRAFDLATGAVRWSWNAGSRLDAGVVLAGSQLIVASERGRVTILDAASGGELSTLELGAAITTSPAVAAGRIVVGTADGVLYALGSR